METETINKIDKHINCVIEDYKAIKSEISRRSELQRFALLAYGGVIVLSLKFNEKPEFSTLQILLIWLASSLTYLFYIAEDRFIKRLGKIATFNGRLISYLSNTKNNGQNYSTVIESISEFYFEQLAKKEENITPEDIIFPSESPIIDKILKIEYLSYNSSLTNAFFLLSYLLILPIIITCYSYFHNECYNDFTSCDFIIILFCLKLNICLQIYLCPNTEHQSK